ncbi:hypothetical protein J3A83DRAFT_4371319 [Scleroderma citrinum]
METPSSTSLLKPRLRLLRRRPSLHTPDNGTVGVASRTDSPVSSDFASSGDEEDEQLTLPPLSGVDSGPSSISHSPLSTDAVPADSPAARLRALLTLTPRDVSSVVRQNLPDTPSIAPPGAWMATPNQPTVQTAAADTPISLLRANSLPAHTPAPPGAWMVTPNQPTARSTITIDESPFGTIGKRKSLLKVRFDVSESESSVSGLPDSPDPQGGPLSPRPLRKSPMVRVVDAYGRETHDTELCEPAEQTPDSTLDIDSIRLGRADTIARMKQTLQEMREGLSDADRVDELDLNSDHLAQLEEVSMAARQARCQLAEKAQSETHPNPNMRKAPPWIKRPSVQKWSRILVYSSLFIQLLLTLVMWRYAHIEAHRLFYTIYYDPLYPELHSLDGSPYFAGRLSPSSSWTIRGSWENIRRDGWRTASTEIRYALQHAGDQVWDYRRDNSYSHTQRPT